MIKNNLRSVRETKNMSQKQLSDSSGIQQPQLARYEEGQIPTYKNMIKLSTALGVTIDEIWPVELEVAGA